MARIELDLPETFNFSTEIAVRISDINYGQHVGNDAILSLIHEARLRIFAELGLKERYDNGEGMLIADAVIVYSALGVYGDVLTIYMTPDDPNKNGFDLVYKLENKRTGVEIARAKTGMVFYNHDMGKVIRMPEKFKKIFSPPESPA